MQGLLTRLTLLLILMGAGAAMAGLFAPGISGIGLGLALGACLWLAWDTWRFLCFLDWLRQLHETPEAPPPPRLSGIWRDVAARIARLLRQQTRLTRECENRLENLRAGLQVSPNGIIVLDKQARIEWCNQTACRHFGLDARRDIAQSVTHLLRDPAFVAHLSARNFDEAVIFSSPDPDQPLRLAVRLCPYGHGQRLLISQDITVFEQAEAMRRDFVANVSHEIRTPLTVLAGFVETLQTLPLTEGERRQYLGRMARQAEHMRRLVDDLLTLSRLEESQPPGLEDWTAVAALLAQIETDARALSAHTTGDNAPHRLAFPEADALSQTGEIAGAAGELHSALFNLVNNAIRYTPPGGEITVCWRPLPDGRASFSVRDSGPGIAPEHIPRLTERFYRVDSARSRATGGTGLGLSIVKHVLQRHDATLAIDSALGQGACFTVTFPAHRVRGALMPPIR